jgi:hypothetical protein
MIPRAATLATESLVLGISWYAASKFLYRLPVHKIMAKPLLASVVMGVIIYWLGQFASINLFLLIGLGAASYFIMLYLTRAFSEEDIKLFRQVVRMARPGTQHPGF